MGMARWDIVNALARQLGAMRYLEVGVQGGICFGQVRVAEKVGVDPDRGSAATVHLPSDDYFARLAAEDRFDLVFVDGLHHREQVHRDIVNAWGHLTPGGAIVVHDCDPPTEAAGSRAMVGGIWCGDVWRGWMDARRTLAGRAYLAVVATDLGCGIVLPLGVAEEVPPPWPSEETDRAEWAFFAKRRAAWLNSITPEEFLALVERVPPIVRG